MPIRTVVVRVALGTVRRGFSASSPRYAGASNPVKASTPNTAPTTTPLNPAGLAPGLKTCGCQSPPGAPLTRMVSASASRTPSSNVSSARSDRTDSRRRRGCLPPERGRADDPGGDGARRDLAAAEPGACALQQRLHGLPERRPGLRAPADGAPVRHRRRQLAHRRLPGKRARAHRIGSEYVRRRDHRHRGPPPVPHDEPQLQLDEGPADGDLPADVRGAGPPEEPLAECRSAPARRRGRDLPREHRPARRPGQLHAPGAVVPRGAVPRAQRDPRRGRLGTGAGPVARARRAVTQDGIMSERFVLPREGCDLAGERWPGGAPLVVLLHEGVSDRRGWGESAVSTAPFTHVDDVLAVLDREQAGQAWLAGASAGGGLALDTALLAPDRVAGLVLFGTAVSGAPE